MALQESFVPYLYLVLWEFSLAALQQIGADEQSGSSNDVGFFLTTMGAVGNSISWVSWILSFWVGHQYGSAAGWAFLVTGFSANVIAVAFLQMRRDYLRPAHIVSVPAMPALAYLTLHSIGFGLPS